MMLIRLAVLLVSTLCFGSGQSWAYNLPAHRLLTQTSVDPATSSFDRVLKYLGFNDGKDGKFLGITASDWVRDGAASEDKPDSRVVQHFHNPLARSWANAGLTVGLWQWFSSVIWQQHPSQDRAPGIYNGAGSWSWPNARDRYHKALTLAGKSEREVKFAEFFRTLGQMMHLVQDASVPAHTRNDPHLTLEVAGIKLVDDADTYETWVDELAANPALLQAFLASRPAIKPSDAIFKLEVNSPRIDRASAPVSVSALIDTGQYVGTNPDATTTPGSGLPTIGLAEYSNANFLSKDTNSLSSPKITETRPYPARSSVELGPPVRVAQSEQEFRRYFSKVRHGDRVEFLAVPSALYEFLPDALKDKKVGLDDTVLADYAAKLLPRAVGYSAALVDYFFRGRLSAFLQIATADGALHGTIYLSNETDESINGTVALYGDAEDGTRRLVAPPQNVVLEPNQTFVPLSISPVSPQAPLPPWLLVFRGQLGAEPDAVAATWAGGGLALVNLFYGSFPASECYSGANFDVATVLWGFPAPVFVSPDKRNAAYVPHITNTLPSCNFVANVMVEPISYEEWPFIHRSPALTPGRSMTTQLGPGGGCGLLELSGAWRPGSPLPATVDIVEFESPASIGDLYAYRMSAPPASRRFIGSVGSGQTLTFDIGDARFLGFRMAASPPAPALGPMFQPYGSPNGTRTSAAPAACLETPIVSFE